MKGSQYIHHQTIDCWTRGPFSFLVKAHSVRLYSLVLAVTWNLNLPTGVERHRGLRSRHANASMATMTMQRNWWQAGVMCHCISIWANWLVTLRCRCWKVFAHKGHVLDRVLFIKVHGNSSSSCRDFKLKIKSGGFGMQFDWDHGSQSIKKLLKSEPKCSREGVTVWRRGHVRWHKDKKGDVDMFALCTFFSKQLTDLLCAITKSHQGLNDATHLPTANISVQIRSTCNVYICPFVWPPTCQSYTRAHI